MTLMKKAYIALAAVALTAAGCRKDEIKGFDKSAAMTEFAYANSDFSFFRVGDTPLAESIVGIPFNIVGWPTAHERNAIFIAVPDSTTLTGFEILDAKVPADSWTGTLRVKVKNNLGTEPVTGDDRPRLYLRAVAGGDFQSGPVNMRDHALKVSNTLQRPAEWTNQFTQYRGLGEYSTAYYSFIIETTGETHFPIALPVAGYNNGEVWSPGYTSALITNLKTKLEERNQRVGSPLLHDDGPGKGQPVVVGKTDYAKQE